MALLWLPRLAQIEVEFTRLAPRMTMSRTLRLYKLPDVRFEAIVGTHAVCGVTTSQAPCMDGVRAMTAADVPRCCSMLNTYLERYAGVCVLWFWMVLHRMTDALAGMT